MSDQAAFMARLPEADRLPFRNLALIRPQAPTEGQLRLIEDLARTLASPRLLTLIARTPHWLVHGPVLEALAQNQATPDLLRRDLELAVALFDLMRDLDRAPDGEKEERAGTVRALYQSLPPDLRGVVKRQAKQLARAIRPTGQTLELPPLPTGDPDWEALTTPPRDPAPRRPVPAMARPSLLVRAETTPIQDELQAYLLDSDPDLRAAALRNPRLAEDTLVPALARCPGPGLLEQVYGQARWYFREPLRAAIHGSPQCPLALARKIAHSRDLVALLERGAQGSRDLRRAVCLFTQLDESEYQYLTFWAKRSAPGMLRVIKTFFDRLQGRRGAPAGAGPWGSLEDVASQAALPEHPAAALKNGGPRLFAMALDHPRLGVRDLLAVIPGLDGPRVELLARHRGWTADPVVREALLHNPCLGEPAALDLLRDPLPLRALLDLLRDPRLPHLEVKGQALALLTAAYRNLTVPQRVQALRASGGELLGHLGQEVLDDQATLDALVADRQADPGTLLRLARNPWVPRELLEQIAAHPVVMAHPSIMAEVVLNPRTPRHLASRLWGLLSSSEQQRLLASPHLPEPLRRLG